MFLKLALLAALACPAALADTLEAFGRKWTVPSASDWKIEKESTGEVLTLLVPQPSVEHPRRPKQFALADGGPFRKFTIEAEAKRMGGSLIVVYAYQDESHFNYIHFSVDAPKKQPVHNGIFHVFGGDRVRISSLEGSGSLPTEEWTQLKVVWDGKSGEVTGWADGKTSPSLRGVDLSLVSGKVGIGSFFEKGSFRNVRITGEP
jgi:hypothetical protein